LIRHRLVHPVWRPLVEFTRRRHVAFRGQLSRGDERAVLVAPNSIRRALTVLSAGV
jgi:hypothetical protein